MIRIDALWQCTQPQDMRAGAEWLWIVVVNTIGRARSPWPIVRRRACQSR